MNFSVTSTGLIIHIRNNKGGIIGGSFLPLTKKQIMDLLSVKKQIIEDTRADKKKTLFIDVDPEGECSIATTFTKGQSMAAYKNGNEISLPEQSETPEPNPSKNKRAKKLPDESVNQSSRDVKPENNMADETVTKAPKKKAAKKTSKKSPAKKAVKKVPSKSNGAEKKIPRGNNMMLTADQWRKVDILLKKEDVSFSAWSRNLVLSKIK